MSLTQLCGDTQERITQALRFKVIEKINFHRSTEMSFFGMPLAQTWLVRTQYNAKDAILVKNEKRYSQRRASRSRPGLGTGRAGLIYS
jgi:hypothetical protein